MSFGSFTTFECFQLQFPTKVLIGTELGEVCLGMIDITQEDEAIYLKSSDNFFKLLEDINTLKQVIKFNSAVRSIKKLSKNRFVVGCHRGELAILEFDDNFELITTNLLQKGGTTQDQIWRLIVLNENEFLTSGTYGSLLLWRKRDDTWEIERIAAHSHSIFCLEEIWSKKIITNDYKGYNYLWEVLDDDIKQYDVETSIGNMQHAQAIDDESFAMININGGIYHFGFRENMYVLETDYSLASGSGYDITLYNDHLVGGTSQEVIFINPTTSEVSFINNVSCRELKNVDGKLLALLSKNLVLLKQEKAKRYEEQRFFYYIKIGLLGHTGVGKSSLCYYLKNNKFEGGKIQSTFGRRIWRLDKQDNYNLSENQQILLYDVAGQESQLFMFYENLSDSDIIFVIFKQTDESTLEKALNHLNEVKKYTSPNCKFYLIQNFCDDEHNAVEGVNFKEICEKHGIDKYFVISSKEGENIDKVKNEIIRDIDWDNAKKTVQSKQFAKVLDFFEKESFEDVSTMSISEIQERLSIRITKRHLKYILQNLSNQGLIEFINETEQLIINDKEFNSLKTRIPERIKAKGGFIRTNDLMNSLACGDKQKEAYVRYQLDLLRKNLEIIVFLEGSQNRELIILPRHFVDENLEIPKEYDEIIPEENEMSFYPPSEGFSWFYFLTSISDLRLDIVQISKSSGIFSTLDKSFCFLIILTEDLLGKQSREKITIFFGGKKPTQIHSFSNKLENIMKNLNYQKIDDITKTKEKKTSNLKSAKIVKKNGINNSPTVFISYAYSTPEHSDWVENLASHLRSYGVICKLDIWNLYAGKSISEFEKEILRVDKVIVICDPVFVEKINQNKTSGVQVEHKYINILIQKHPKGEKIIPILKEGNKETSIPEELHDIKYVDFREESEYDMKLKELIKAIWDQPNRSPPPLGPLPDFVVD